MSTLVCFHAHPDDEAIATGGVMAMAKADGHKVILLVATRGEMGEPVDGVLDEGELLGDRREIETHESAAILGIDGVSFLGYRDSGMIGEESNDDPACFWQADVEHAAQQVAALLTEVEADVFTIYDEHGGYGHPDHIQVNRVGTRAAEIAGVDRVFWSTMNRTRIMAMQAEMPLPDMDEEDIARIESEEFGMEEADLTHAVDVSAFIQQKRRSMAAHASQIDGESFFMAMPQEVFAMAFGTEWFVAPGTTRSGDFVTSLFDAPSATG